MNVQKMIAAAATINQAGPALMAAVNTAKVALAPVNAGAAATLVSAATTLNAAVTTFNLAAAEPGAKKVAGDSASGADRFKPLTLTAKQ